MGLEKSYEQGIEESIQLLEALKERKGQDFYAKMIVFEYIKEKEMLFDKNGKRIECWDVMKINPEDDSWLDLVIRYEGRLIFASEISSEDSEPVRLREVLQGSDNPAVIVGNLRNCSMTFEETEEK